MQKLDDLWMQVAGTIEPVAHLLKCTLSKRWVRFHSLPESKRYPDTDLEMAAVVCRHNELLQAIMNFNEEMYEVCVTWSPETESGAVAQGYQFWKTILMDGDDPDSERRLYAKLSKWRPGCLDQVIRSAANDELFGYLVIGVSSHNVYHPYDGGMDLIFESEKGRNDVAEVFKSYLSGHPDGL